MYKVFVVIVGPFLITGFLMLDMFFEIQHAAADADVAVYLAAALYLGRRLIIVTVSQQLAHKVGQESSHVLLLLFYLFVRSHQSGSRTFLPWVFGG